MRAHQSRGCTRYSSAETTARGIRNDFLPKAREIRRKAPRAHHC
ncbi:hypothetical protein ACF07S_32445 [Streptomyces sp. NPDC016640]